MARRFEEPSDPITSPPPTPRGVPRAHLTTLIVFVGFGLLVYAEALKMLVS